jgi:hypothetical protein
MLPRKLTAEDVAAGRISSGITTDSLDINHWYNKWLEQGGKCPNCGIIFDQMPPIQNLYPHWTGACKEPPPSLAEQSLKWQELFVNKAMREYKAARDLREHRDLWRGTFYALLIVAAGALVVDVAARLIWWVLRRYQ